MILRRLKEWSVGIVLLATTVAFIAVAEFNSERLVSGEVARAPSALVTSTGSSPLRSNPFVPLSLDELSATRDRPLFSPSRRPAPSRDAPRVALLVRPLPPPPPAEPERPQLNLVGTILGEQDAIGIFVEQVSKNLIRLRNGESYQGWICVRSKDERQRWKRHDRQPC